jgi:hypothetical protein
MNNQLLRIQEHDFKIFSNINTNLSNNLFFALFFLTDQRNPKYFNLIFQRDLLFNRLKESR